jgi:hippurate hydrolase
MVVGASIVMSLQTIVSRNIDPQDATVVTVGFFKAGSAYNVIPGEAHIGGTTRTTTPENRALAQRRIKEICDGAAQMYGVQVEVEHRPGYPPTVNNPEKTRFAIEVAADVCGGHAVRDNMRPSMGAEDFSYMLEKVPGAMVMLGNGGSEAINLHNPSYDFNDMAIPFGISFFVKTVERFLGEQKAG